jgi:hypothetical protein
MATDCLQAACSLISILPDKPDIAWLVRVTPWWSVLHFIMQATTALLLALSFACFPDQTPLPNSSTPTSNSTSTSESKAQSQAHPNQKLNAPSSSTISVSPTDPAIPNALALLDTDLDAVIALAKKALLVIHTMATVDPAARRAFLLCDGVVRKLAPALKIDLREWPRVEGLGGGVGGVGEEGRRGSRGSRSGSRMEVDVQVEGLEDLVDFDGGTG